MSCDSCECETACGLLPDFPYAIRYNSPRCPIIYPNWKYDPHRQDFCNKWGHFAPGLCPRPCNPCKDIHIPVCSFDKFSKPPLFHTSKCLTHFRYQRRAFFDDPSQCCPKPNRKSAYDCEDASSMINRTHYGEDVICGNCPTEKRPQRKQREKPCEREFPFIIMQCPEVKVEPMKIRTGAERCLHPSNIRYLKSSNHAAVPDFYKMRTRDELQLYRAKYAIDNRRKPPSLPCGEKDKVICEWPITVNAKCAKWKGSNLRPTHNICIPNPLVVQKLDFSIGDLRDLNTSCKIMPVVC